MPVPPSLVRVLATTALASQLGALFWPAAAAAEPSARIIVRSEPASVRSSERGPKPPTLSLATPGATAGSPLRIRADGSSDTRAAAAPPAVGAPPHRRKNRRAGVDFSPTFNMRAPSRRPQRPADTPVTAPALPQAVRRSEASPAVTHAAAPAVGLAGMMPADTAAEPRAPDVDVSASAGGVDKARVPAVPNADPATAHAQVQSTAAADHATNLPAGHPVPARSPRRPAELPASAASPEQNFQASVATAAVVFPGASTSVDATAHPGLAGAVARDRRVPFRHPRRPLAAATSVSVATPVGAVPSPEAPTASAHPAGGAAVMPDPPARNALAISGAAGPSVSAAGHEAAAEAGVADASELKLATHGSAAAADGSPAVLPAELGGAGHGPTGTVEVGTHVPRAGEGVGGGRDDRNAVGSTGDGNDNRDGDGAVVGGRGGAGAGAASHDANNGAVGASLDPTTDPTSDPDAATQPEDQVADADGSEHGSKPDHGGRNAGPEADQSEHHAGGGSHEAPTGEKDDHGSPDAEVDDPEWDTPDTDPMPPGPRPVQLARMLTALQDDIALGSSDALAAQRVLSRRIAERFRAATRKEWRDPGNARALAIYALSGGDPAVVRDVLQKTRLKNPYKALVAGALAFLEGRAKDAKRHFDTIGTEEVDASVRGSMLLAQAALVVADDPAGASAYLDEARLAAPGTLVEEAALRRAILIAAERDELPSFERMVDRYLRKFRASVYAGNFRQRFAAALTRMTFIRDPQTFPRLDAMLEPMTEAGRQELYLMVARAAVENGNHLAAQLAARRVQETAEPGTLDHRRARLYQAAAEVVDAPLSAAAVGTLTALGAEPLPAEDRALLAAALSLSRTVMDLPAAQLLATAAPDYVAVGDGFGIGSATAGHAAALSSGPVGDATGQPVEAAAADGLEGQSDGNAASPVTAEAGDTHPFAPPLEMERRVSAAIAAVDDLLEEAN